MIDIQVVEEEEPLKLGPVQPCEMDTLTTRQFMDKFILPGRNTKVTDLTNPWLLSAVGNHYSSTTWYDSPYLIKRRTAKKKVELEKRDSFTKNLRKKSTAVQGAVKFGLLQMAEELHSYESDVTPEPMSTSDSENRLEDMVTTPKSIYSEGSTASINKFPGEETRGLDEFFDLGLSDDPGETRDERELDEMEPQSLPDVNNQAETWRQQFAGKLGSRTPKIKIEDEYRNILNSYASSFSSESTPMGSFDAEGRRSTESGSRESSSRRASGEKRYQPSEMLAAPEHTKLGTLTQTLSNVHRFAALARSRREMDKSEETLVEPTTSEIEGENNLYLFYCTELILILFKVIRITKFYQPLPRRNEQLNRRSHSSGGL